MCDFISWIEVKKNNETIILYLEDKDVFSTDGREILGNPKDNDVLGHGAIRKYYDLSENEGTDYEKRNFWYSDKLPDELKKKVKNFSKYWGKIWDSGAFQEDDLEYIIRNGPKEWRKKALEQFLKSYPSANFFDSSDSLQGKILKEEDYILFENLLYKVTDNYLFRMGFFNNDVIFDKLNLEKFTFCKNHYNYESLPKNYYDSVFPISKFQDYAALTRVTIALFKELEKQNK